MKLEELVLEGWRNWKSSILRFSGGVNVFYGGNGQGKTNLLEAIYFLAHLNSFRTFRRVDLLQWGATRFRLEGAALTADVPKRLKVQQRGQNRSVFVNGTAVSDLWKYFDGVRVVLFAPQHVELVRGLPMLRRRFMDRGAFRRNPGHLALVREYSKVLRSRNALLRGKERDLLKVYTARLSRVGACVVLNRLHAVDAINERIGGIHRRLTSTEEEVEIRYRSRWCSVDCAEKSVLEESLLGEFRQNERTDEDRGFTTAGPHTDDLEFRLDGRPARTFASQGQARSIALALSMAEHEMLLEHHGEPPVFLMDDLSSELDDSRRSGVVDYLMEMKGQLFVTTTSVASLPAGVRIEEFEIIDGQVSA